MSRLFSSHRLEELEQIAEYVGVFEHGKLMVESRLDDIKGDFRLIAKVSTLTTIDRLWVDCQRLAISGFWIGRPASLKTLFCLSLLISGHDGIAIFRPPCGICIP